MDTVNTVENRSGAGKSAGILYPLMLIAAITVIVFSVAGIATMMGWLPNVQSKAEPADKAPPAKSASAAGRPRMMSSAACGDCGVVESIRAVEAKGEGSALGAGAYAAHEIEKNVNKSVDYQVRVRMNDGSIRTFHDRAQPALAIGQKVRVTGQGIVAAG